MTPNFLKKIITAHYIWLESYGKSGQRADLWWADLENADFRDADLRSADFQNANLRAVTFNNANLRYANLRYADLTSANLQNADLRYADLNHANFTDAEGLLNPIEWMNSNFQKNSKGYIVFKKIGKGLTLYPPPTYWVIEEDSYLTETVDKDRQRDCSYGINFGTRDWCEKYYIHANLWECLLEFDDLEKLVVPYRTNGKARCNRLKLLRKEDKNESI